MEENQVTQEQTFDQPNEDLGLDDVFSDTGLEETTEEPAQETSQQEPESLEGNQTPPEDAGKIIPQNTSDTVNAKFLGREIPIPKQALEGVSKALGINEAQAVVMLQKGMNYDRILQKTQQETAVLDEYARMAGLSREEFVTQLVRQQQQMKVQNQVETLRKQHPDADEGLLRQTAQTNVALQERIQKEAAVRRAMEQRAIQNRQWVAFFKARPDITDVKSIPQEVMQAVSMGESPQSAYLRWENSQLQTQLAQLKQQQKNQQTAAPSAASSGGAQQRDEFSQGFDAVWN